MEFRKSCAGCFGFRERKRLGKVKLAIPLHGEGALKGFPLGFYVEGRTVTIPMMSLKFLNDLSLSYAYLFEHSYSLESVSDYALILKYQIFPDPSRTIQNPLKALRIPTDAKYDKDVRETAEKISKSALVWIMGHELGHIYFNHAGYGIDRLEAQRNEMEADRFANRVMRGIGMPPLGIVNFFMVDAHISVSEADFPTRMQWEAYRNSEATHPVTAQRLHALARDLREDPESFVWREPDPNKVTGLVRYTADQIDGIAAILDKPGIQRILTARGRSLNLDSLRPKR